MGGAETVRSGNTNMPLQSRRRSSREDGRGRFGSVSSRLAAPAAALLTLALTSLASGLAATPASASTFGSSSFSSLSFNANGLTPLSVDDSTSCGAGYTDDPTDPTTSDLVCIPDTNLLDAVDKVLGEAAGTPVTVAQAQGSAFTGVLGTSAGQLTVSGPVTDLTGLQVFANLTYLQINTPGNTFTDLTPLSELTKLTSLYLENGALTSADLAPLSDLTGLTTLDLANNHISDLGNMPVLPNAQSIELSGNQIQDPSPLVNDLEQAALLTLTQLDLSDNQISDASPLAALGDAGTIFGANGSLDLAGNQIANFSAFSGWSSTHPIGATGQTILAGHPTGGSVSVTLKTPNGSAVSVSPATAGAYDASTGTLTLTDPSSTSVSVSPDWTVDFTAPAGDPDGPTISGNPAVGQELTASVSGAGSALAGCTNVSYRWLRDGAVFAGALHWTDDVAGAAGVASPGVMGDPGLSPVYYVGAADLGHQLSVQATCEDTSGPDAGLSMTSAPTQLGSPGFGAEQPMLETLDGYSTVGAGSGGSAVNVTTEARSGVVGDPTNPTVPVFISQADGSGDLVNPAQLGLAVTSVSGTMTAAQVTVGGTGSERTISFNPQSVGYSTIVLTLTGTTGLTTTFTLGYYVSMATTPTSRVLEGSSDDSTAIDVGDGYFMDGDDEKNNIRLYNGAVSGREVAQFAPPSVAPTSEMDLEASARQGNQLYFFGSEGNNKSGSIEPARDSVFSEALQGSGADATLTPGVYVSGFRDALIAWDESNANKFGLAAGTAKGNLPELANGLDLEGAEFSPDGSELYLGMRAPIYPASPGGDAVIFTVTNFDTVIADAQAGMPQSQLPQWQFGNPILLNLGGQSIREIRKNADNQYLIIAGQAATEGAGSGPAGNSLWAWDGEPGDQPQELSTVLPADQEAHETGEESGDWEGITDMPNPITAGSQVRLLMDQGFDVLYHSGAYGGQDDKDITGDDYVTKGRTDVFTLTGAVGTIANLSGSGTFPDQAANTIGKAQTITVANGGSDPLSIGQVNVTDTDGSSASDFLITQDHCSQTTLAIGGSCTIQVRFAPQDADATSTAQLVVNSNVPSGSSTMALTGNSSDLPAGQTGQAGSDGANGSAGVTGPAGAAGSGGQTGQTGPAGPAGPAGQTGATGSKGPAGPRGKSGAEVTASVKGKAMAGKRSSLSVTVLAKGVIPTGKVAAKVAGKTVRAQLKHGHAVLNVVFKTSGLRKVTVTYGGSGNVAKASTTTKIKVAVAPKLKPARRRAHHANG